MLSATCAHLTRGFRVGRQARITDTAPPGTPTYWFQITGSQLGSSQPVVPHTMVCPLVVPHTIVCPEVVPHTMVCPFMVPHTMVSSKVAPVCGSIVPHTSVSESVPLAKSESTSLKTGGVLPL